MENNLRPIGTRFETIAEPRLNSTDVRDLAPRRYEWEVTGHEWVLDSRKEQAYLRETVKLVNMTWDENHELSYVHSDGEWRIIDAKKMDSSRYFGIV